MQNTTKQIVKLINQSIKRLGKTPPASDISMNIIDTIQQAAYLTEEGRQVRSSVTYLDPRLATDEQPSIIRAHYPIAWPLAKKLPFTSKQLIKLSRAIDYWTGSIAIYHGSDNELYIWGVIDQQAKKNIAMHHETDGSFLRPGLFTVVSEGLGNISIYHANMLIAGVREHKVIKSENDVFLSEALISLVLPHLRMYALSIRDCLERDEDEDFLLYQLYLSWTTTVRRLCLRIKQSGTGGSLLVTPSPSKSDLDISHRFSYPRMGDAMVLHSLDEQYMYRTQNCYLNAKQDGLPAEYDIFSKVILAAADADDRAIELADSTKLVASLASMDGIVVMSPLLHVLGFGAKIGNCKTVRTVYNGAEHESDRSTASLVDIRGFGTRHNSMLRYCKVDSRSLGIIISQDGGVRVVLTSGKSIVMWENVKLLDYGDLTKRSILEHKDWLDNRVRSKTPSRGYSDMPKTTAGLLKQTPRK